MTERMTAKQFNSRRAKPRDIEGPIQIDIVNWLRKVLPSGSIVHHCQNEIRRSGGGFAREQVKARERGTVTGFPDLIVLPYANVGAFFLEVKAPKGYPSKPQKLIHVNLSRLGYRVAVVRSVDDARAALRQWGIGFIEPADNQEVAL